MCGKFLEALMGKITLATLNKCGDNNVTYKCGEKLV